MWFERDFHKEDRRYRRKERGQSARPPSRPHAPLAIFLEQLVPAGGNGAGLLAHRDVPRRSVRFSVYGPVDHVTSVIVRSERSQHPIAHRRVAGAFAFHLNFTLVGRRRRSSREERFDAISGLSHAFMRLTMSAGRIVAKRPGSLGDLRRTSIGQRSGLVT